MKQIKKTNSKTIVINGVEGTEISWEEYQKMMEEKAEEAAKEETWPTWLTKEGFENWYNEEQIWRKYNGKPLMKNPPFDVIRQYFLGE